MSALMANPNLSAALNQARLSSEGRSD
jgi:hypothetical protein